jgi:hypothetical protein
LWVDGRPDLDPASNPDSQVNAREDYQVERGEDGLARPWSGRVFLNPPYSKPEPWLRRARQHLAIRAATTIALIKCDPSTTWWNKHVWTATQVGFIRTRVRFLGGESSANFPVALVNYGYGRKAFAEALDGFAEVR